MREGAVMEDGVSGEMKVVYVSSGCLDCLEDEGELLRHVEVNRPD